MAFGKGGMVLVAFVIGLVLGLMFDYAVDWGYGVHMIVGIFVYVIFGLQIAATVKYLGVASYALALVIGEAVALGIMYAQ